MLPVDAAISRCCWYSIHSPHHSPCYLPDNFLLGAPVTFYKHTLQYAQLMGQEGPKFWGIDVSGIIP